MMGIREAVRQGLPVPVPVIDAHTHLGEYSLGGLHQNLPDLEAVVKHMDKVGVNCVVTSPAPLTFGDMTLTNDLTVEMMRAFPGRIYGNIFFGPHDGAEAVKQTVSKYSKVEGFVGIKLLSGTHGEPDRPELEPVWAFAQEARCPVSIHMSSKDPSVGSILRLLEKYPEVKMILSHQGGKKASIPVFVEQMRDHKVYLDTSSDMKMPFPELVETCGEDRLTCGSDFVLHDFAEEMGKIIFSGISETAMKKILAENYLSLLEGSQLTKISL